MFSDSGLFLIKEFLNHIQFGEMLEKLFKTTYSVKKRIHTVLYQIFAAYFEDDKADILTHQPVIKACL